MNVLAGSDSTRRATTRRPECLRALVLGTALMFTLARATAGSDRDVDIRVHVEGDVVSVDASMLVAATPQEVWSVFTDFDHLAQFISNLKSSAVVARNGDAVTIAQAGEASYGPLKFAFESVRELRLLPIEKIRSHMISGNMKRFAGVTEFAAEDAGTRVTYHSDAVPDRWIPPLIGPRFIEQETREQLSEFRAEVLRRKLAQAAVDKAESLRHH
jgi:carbon monoxide dehydrogenase subunit G